MKKALFILIFITVLALSSVLPVAALASNRAEGFACNLREKGISPLLVTGLISMIPIFELRGGIPVGIALFKLNPFLVYFTCLIFNLIPVFPILLLLHPVKRLLANIPPFRGFFRFLIKRAEKQKKLIEKYEEFGLMLFVGIPLPVTGAWTGSLVAVLMGLKVLKSFLFIALGVMLAGIIVTILTVLGIYGIVLALIIIAGFFTVYLVRMRKEVRENQPSP